MSTQSTRNPKTKKNSPSIVGGIVLDLVIHNRHYLKVDQIIVMSLMINWILWFKIKTTRV